MKDISVDFNEFVEMRANDLIKYFNKLDKTMLAKSLKTIDPKISEMIFKNIPQNDSDEIKTLMTGAVRIEEVETAQMEIINMINK